MFTSKVMNAFSDKNFAAGVNVLGPILVVSVYFGIAVN